MKIILASLVSLHAPSPSLMPLAIIEIVINHENGVIDQLCTADPVNSPKTDCAASLLRFDNSRILIT